MVGIVIVAHSEELANAIRVLTEKLVPGGVKIAGAGGINDPLNPYGTDPLKIREAISSVYSKDGVLVLMDMGSSLMSAEVALELLPSGEKENVLLCEAPLVEGAIAAAVCARGGCTLSEVAAEARGALEAKALHLGKARTSGAGDVTVSTKTSRDDVLVGKYPEERKIPIEKSRIRPEEYQERIKLTIKNPLGIHARPAARFVTTAAGFQADIMIKNLSRDTDFVSAKSINSVTMLDVRQGDSVLIIASGPDAGKAIRALTKLVEEEFGEPDSCTAISWKIPPADRAMEQERSYVRKEDRFFTETPSPAKEKYSETRDIKARMIFKGVPASPGIATGKAFFPRPIESSIPLRKPDDPEQEWNRITKALDAAEGEIKSTRVDVSATAGEYEASIFDAHLLILRDPVLVELVRKHIFEKRLNAEQAWQLGTDEFLNNYLSSESRNLRLRGADLSDVRTRVLASMLGKEAISFEPDEPSILIASDLSPSEIARVDPEKITGICTSAGGVNSHSAILARAIGIPMVVGVGPEILRIDPETPLALDGNEGLLIAEPPLIEKYRKLQKRVVEDHKRLEEEGKKPALTIDGKKIEVLANIGSIPEGKLAIKFGAEGIGVLRTEFLFMRRLIPPSEDEQFDFYKKIATLISPRPLTIRALDAGGDKNLPFLELKPEPNPSLGLRGIRVLLRQTSIFKTQLRAILRISSGFKTRVLLPMVSTVDEIKGARALLREAQEELSASGIPFDKSIEVGIMVEVPSAAILAERLAGEADFFSIGTNDLVQYVLASDRTTTYPPSLNDPLQPAVLRLIHQTISVAHSAGIRAGVCGEMAGDIIAVPILVGLGIDELSMSPRAIPQVKETIRKLTTAKAGEIAASALKIDTPEEIRKFVRNELKF